MAGSPGWAVVYEERACSSSSSSLTHLSAAVRGSVRGVARLQPNDEGRGQWKDIVGSRRPSNLPVATPPKKRANIGKVRDERET
jgi:hypothetical protein